MTNFMRYNLYTRERGRRKRDREREREREEKYSEERISIITK